MNNPQRVVVAELIRPRGNKGEVLAASQTDVPGRLESLKRAWVSDQNGHDREVELEAVWQHKDHWVLKFAGVDSITAAEEFAGSDLWLPLEQRGRLPEGEYFRTDLIGFRVVLAGTDQEIGRVDGWQQYGGPPLLELKANGRELLIPFVEPICKVDTARAVIEVDPPEGLLEL